MTRASNSMALMKALKWQAQHGFLARRVVIRGIIFAVAISTLPLMQMLCDVDQSDMYSTEPIDDCTKIDKTYLGLSSYFGRVLKPVVTPLVLPHLVYSRCRESMNLTTELVKELTVNNLLNYESQALYLGRESASAVSTLRKLGFHHVYGVRRHPFCNLNQKNMVYKLDFKPNSYGLIITRDVDKVSLPALFISEVERVLKPGGMAVMLVKNTDIALSSGSLVKAATTISAFLKSSNVVHVASLKGHTMVVLKKNPIHINSLLQYSLPAECPSFRQNKPYIGKMEPVDHHGSHFTYLPSLIDMSSKTRLVYIDAGEKEVANFSQSNWFLPSYPVDSRDFSVYIVDHNALVLSSHVQKPGVTFIYHLGFNADSSTQASDTDTHVQSSKFRTHDVDDDEDFDFLTWFKETVLFSDFVVLKMKAGRAELKFLLELFESGAICYVDELFLQCSNLDGSGFDGSCMDLFNDLRSSGVFVHQWFGN